MQVAFEQDTAYSMCQIDEMEFDWDVVEIALNIVVLYCDLVLP